MPKKFDPKVYLDSPCEFMIGSEERILVMQCRLEFMRPLTHPGDSILAVPAFKERKEVEYMNPRTGRIVPGRTTSED